MTRLLACIVGLVIFGLASKVRADPCEGSLPGRPGAVFSGLVRYVGDGDGLCVGVSSDPATWIEVRLADFDALELSTPDGRRAGALLRTLALGQRVSCTATPGRGGRVISYDRVIATCRLDGRLLGDRLRAAGAPEGGN